MEQVVGRDRVFWSSVGDLSPGSLGFVADRRGARMTRTAGLSRSASPFRYPCLVEKSCGNGRRRCCAPTKTYSGLLVGHEVAAAVLLPAGFGGLHAEGLFLAPTGGGQTLGRNAKADEVLLDGVGSAIAQSEIVFGRTALVAVAFDGDASLGIILEEVGCLLQCLARIGPDFGGVVVEISIADLFVPEFIKAELGSFGDRSVDRDADRRVGIATGGAGREGVGCGSGGRDRSGTLRS